MMIIKLNAALLAAAITTAVTSQPVYRAVPVPGVRHYTYQVIQTINGTTHKGYRTSFDIESKGGELFAIIRNTSELDGDSWKPVTPDAGCRKAMHGGADSIARVKLYPLGSNAHDLGASFLDLCAPQAVFFPLTDILNATMIPLPGTFNATDLRKIGDAVPFAAFEANFDRAGERIHETTDGGKVQLAALDNRVASIDWAPHPAKLTTTDQTPQGPMTLDGTEGWAFRVEVDPHTGIMQRASTTSDDLDLKIVGAPDSVPHIRISREVKIERK
jgi:hypothetical protein